MSVLATLLLVQAAPVVGAVPQRSPELDAANDCLVSATGQWLEGRSSAPDANKRWEWARVIVARCDSKLSASVSAKSPKDDVLAELRREGAAVSISRQDLIRSEAMYYVDGMIRAHFESEAE